MKMCYLAIAGLDMWDTRKWFQRKLPQDASCKRDESIISSHSGKKVWMIIKTNWPIINSPKVTQQEAQSSGSHCLPEHTFWQLLCYYLFILYLVNKPSSNYRKNWTLREKRDLSISSKQFYVTTCVAASALSKEKNLHRKTKVTLLF